MLKKILLALFIAYIIGGLFLISPMYSFCVLRPSRAARVLLMETVHGAKPVPLIIQRPDGMNLSGWFFKVPESNELAIVHHGRGGNLFNRLFLAQKLIDHKISVLLYDYRGYGESDGEAQLSQLVDDALVAHDYALKQLAFKPMQIITYGESIGTGVACEVAKQRECSAVVLQSPFSSLPLEAQESIPILFLYPVFLFPGPKFDNVSFVKQPHPPLLIIHGELDKRIHVSHAQKLFKEAVDPKALVTLPNAGHNNVGGVDAELYTEALTKFFNKFRADKVQSH